MLLLADRGFFSFALWGKAAETAPTGLAHVQPGSTAPILGGL